MSIYDLTIDEDKRTIGKYEDVLLKPYDGEVNHV